MKNQIVIIMLLTFFSTTSKAQNSALTRFIDDVEIAKLGMHYNNKYHNVEGSPYSNSTFTKVKISGLSSSLLMRYNIFDDEFEFIDDKNDTLILLKNKDLKNITFVDSNIHYQLVEYPNSNKKIYSGYFINVHEMNNYILFKKQNISFIKEKFAANSFEHNSPAKFKTAKDSYFLKFSDKTIIDFPNSKKSFFKAFPERKVEFETFFKKENIDFSKETDLVKIIDFLAHS